MRARIAGLLVFSVVGYAAAQQQPPPPPESEPMKPSLGAAGPFSCPACDLRGARFEPGDFTDANLAGANLIGADLRGLTMQGADFSGADLTGAKLDGLKCHLCIFSRAILTDATLDGAQLEGSDFQFADVHGTHFGNSTLTGVSFGPKLKGGVSKSGKKTTFTGALLAHEFELDASIDTGGAKLSGVAVAPPAAGEAWACGAADLSAIKTRIHVSPDGKDSDSCGSSTSEACATIAKGIARCGSTGCGVLVAWGEYQPPATVALRDGLNVYGGCVPSSRSRKDYVSVIKGPAGQPAVTSSVSAKTILQGFDIVGADSKNDDGAPSIAMTVVNSSQTHVLNSRVTAGKGANGAPGGGGGDGARGGDARDRDGGLNGGCGNANGGAGADEYTVSIHDDDARHCYGHHSNGGWGFGGEMGSTGVSAGGGKDGSPNCAICPIHRGDDGGQGAYGTNAGCGAAGTASHNPEGRFEGAKWVGIPGGDGGIGGVGGGGGGGGAGGYRGGICFGIKTENPGNRGGGGGAGGCGGGIGRGGQQGGGSFALVVVGSTLTLTDARVVGGRGGNGGNAGNGGRGGAPGRAADGATHRDGGGHGGPGGGGGAGGSAGGGAGGNSGPSIALAQINSTINDARANILAGTTGNPGTHGAGGRALYNGLCNAPDGQDGVAGTVAAKRQY
jgi:hypothetical protein